tara:strand:- start:165 stop:395 length:231 start_codon:yes stop_codon:yes gene_type:complete
MDKIHNIEGIKVFSYPATQRSEKSLVNLKHKKARRAFLNDEKKKADDDSKYGMCWSPYFGCTCQRCKSGRIDHWNV